MDTETKTSNAARMMSLFEGFAEAYGTYDSTQFNETKGKQEIRATAKTKREKVNVSLWENHLSGVTPLGIIPIRDNDTCLWGCIDVDQYGLQHSDIVKRINKEDLPLVVCRSKSGGAHLYLFLQQPIGAGILMARLNEIAALLGYGGSEVFPKQQKVASDRGDLGSWLNMPYFQGDETNRYGVKDNGLAMSIEEFLDTAEAKRVPPDFLRQERQRKPETDPEFGDGPPCLQHLASDGFPEGVRNKGLFALGVFAKKKFGARWASILEDWNRRFFEPPLPSSEVADIIRGLEKKEYNYTCKEQPLCAHCNSGLCRSRRFGVGGNDDFPIISGLSKLDTDPPIWFLDVDGERIELTTDELCNYAAFHKVCVERLNKFYRISMKRETWGSIVAEQMQNLVKIEAPEEVSVFGQFSELLETFLTDKHKAESKEEVMLGKPFLDLDEGRYYFRLRDLEKFLESSGFKIYKRAMLTTRIKSLGGGGQFFNLKGKGVNTWWVPADTFSATPELPLPAIERSPI
jgi:hypothetical protein